MFFYLCEEGHPTFNGLHEILTYSRTKQFGKRCVLMGCGPWVFTYMPLPEEV